MKKFKLKNGTVSYCLTVNGNKTELIQVRKHTISFVTKTKIGTLNSYDTKFIISFKNKRVNLYQKIGNQIRNITPNPNKFIAYFNQVLKQKNTKNIYYKSAKLNAITNIIYKKAKRLKFSIDKKLTIRQTNPFDLLMKLAYPLYQIDCILRNKTACYSPGFYSGVYRLKTIEEIENNLVPKKYKWMLDWIQKTNNEKNDNIKYIQKLVMLNLVRGLVSDNFFKEYYINNTPRIFSNFNALRKILKQLPVPNRISILTDYAPHTLERALKEYKKLKLKSIPDNIYKYDKLIRYLTDESERMKYHREQFNNEFDKVLHG